MSEMKIIDLSTLKEEDIRFTNEHEPWEESKELEMSFIQNSWGNNYNLWVDGQIVASFKTFKGLVNRAMPIIIQFNLKKVQ